MPQTQNHVPPALPHVWIGYLLAITTTFADVVSVDQQPDVAGGQFVIPPLYVFLPSFVGVVYWLVCVYRIHVFMNSIPGWVHPISPARAVGFHFIPFYQLYWMFKWPRAIALFVNQQMHLPLMKPVLIGVTLLLALALRILAPGPGLLLLFMPLSYVVKCIRTAVAATSPPGEALE
ncbi:MAG TPA: hypothetical protein VK525_16605 [Candidatus Saccharimonadales bacterium]|nr:hypothetical protein [Candidatus Saccharimonadales bacterium]